MTKKKYEIPRMDIILIHADTQLMAGSVMVPGGDNVTPGAPLFGDDWIEIPPTISVLDMEWE